MAEGFGPRFKRLREKVDAWGKEYDERRAADKAFLERDRARSEKARAEWKEHQARVRKLGPRVSAKRSGKKQDVMVYNQSGAKATEPPIDFGPKQEVTPVKKGPLTGQQAVEEVNKRYKYSANNNAKPSTPNKPSVPNGANAVAGIGLGAGLGALTAKTGSNVNSVRRLLGLGVPKVSSGARPLLVRGIKTGAKMGATRLGGALTAYDLARWVVNERLKNRERDVQRVFNHMEAERKRKRPPENEWGGAR